MRKQHVGQCDLEAHSRRTSSSSGCWSGPHPAAMEEQWGVEEHHLIPAQESTRPTHHLYPVWGKQPFENHLLIAPNGIIKATHETGRVRKPATRDSELVIKSLKNKVLKRIKSYTLYKYQQRKKKINK